MSLEDRIILQATFPLTQTANNLCKYQSPHPRNVHGGKKIKVFTRYLKWCYNVNTSVSLNMPFFSNRILCNSAAVLICAHVLPPYYMYNLKSRHNI